MYSVNPSDVFAPHEHIFYWRKKGGKKEVDFVIKDKKGEFLGIEVKYQNTINPHDYTGLNTFKKGILISKKEFNVTKNYVTIPVSLFLLLI
ncbi:MAG: ATP-binding protein, partial [Methanosarcinales archaeon]|nr:ATP-binding protein [Methanosarcinales archaeon]